jgi:hypothetical protein
VSYARAGSTPAAGTKLTSITNHRCPKSPAIWGFFMPDGLLLFPLDMECHYGSKRIVKSQKPRSK